MSRENSRYFIFRMIGGSEKIIIGEFSSDIQVLFAVEYAGLFNEEARNAEVHIVKITMFTLLLV